MKTLFLKLANKIAGFKASFRKINKEKVLAATAAVLVVVTVIAAITVIASRKKELRRIENMTPVTVQWGETVFDYDGTEKLPECSASVSEIELTISVSGAQKNAGTHMAKAEITGFESQLYYIENAEQEFTINKGHLVLTAADSRIQKGEKLKGNGISLITGFAEGETVVNAGITGILQYDFAGCDESSPVGVYENAIIPNGLSSPNYELKFLPGTLEICEELPEEKPAEVLTGVVDEEIEPELYLTEIYDLNLDQMNDSEMMEAISSFEQEEVDDIIGHMSEAEWERFETLLDMGFAQDQDQSPQKLVPFRISTDGKVSIGDEVTVEVEDGELKDPDRLMFAVRLNDGTETYIYTDDEKMKITVGSDSVTFSFQNKLTVEIPIG